MSLEAIHITHEQVMEKKAMQDSILTKISDTVDTDLTKPYGVGLHEGISVGLGVPYDTILSGLAVDIDVAIAKDIARYNAGKQLGQLLGRVFLLGQGEVDE